MRPGCESCWNEQKVGFPEEFAWALTRFLETRDKRDQIVTFLLDIFAGEANEETEKLHVTRGSKKLWPQVVRCLEQGLVRKGESKWISVPADEARQRMRQLITTMETVGTRKNLRSVGIPSYHDKRFANKNAKKLLEAIQNLKRDIERVDREAKKIAIEATLESAPWERQASTFENA